MLDPDLQKREGRGGGGVRSPRPCNNTNKQQCYHICKEPQSEFSQFNIGGEPGEWERRGLQTPTLFTTKIAHFVACVPGDGLEVVGERDNGRSRGRHACLLLARPFFLLRRLLISLPCLRQETLLSDPDLFSLAYRIK